MEDLWFNAEAAFTRFVVAKGVLREPFVVVDVGVQGGANVRWNLLGEYLVLHGFDAIEEVINALSVADSGRPNRRFHNFAIGNMDGERTFYFNAANPTASSMYAQGATRFDDKEAPAKARTVAVRRLDTLFAAGLIPPADFLKVDVEGFEKEVYDGARTFLSSGVLGVETESNFHISPLYPRSHFAAISDVLIEHGLTLFDLGFNRIPRASFTRALLRRGIRDADRGLGRPATFNFLFCRDLIDERDSPQNYLKPPAAPSVDQIIKMMIIYELHGLNDIAVDTADRFAETLRPRLDVEAAIDMLATANCRPGTDPVPSQTMAQQLQAMEQSMSWRITAPLRATKNFVSKRHG